MDPTRRGAGNEGDGRPPPPIEAPAPIAAPGACPVCGEAIVAGPLLACRDCSTLHHEACWHFSRGCSIYGCTCRTAVEPSLALPSGQAPFRLVDWSGARADPFWWAVAVLVPVAALWAAAGFPSLAVAALLSLVPALYAYGLLRRFVLRRALFFDPASGAVRTQWTLLGIPLSRAPRPWLPPGAVERVELHMTTAFRIHVERIFLILRSGRRRLIYDTFTHCPWYRLDGDEVRALAEAVARATDAVVRVCASSDARETAAPLLRASEDEVRGAGAPPPPISEGTGNEKAAAGKAEGLPVPRGPARCRACGEPAIEEVVACARCRSAHHRRCWEAGRGCALAGCNGRLAEDSPLPAAAAAPFALEVPTRFAPWCYLLALFLPAAAVNALLLAQVVPAVPSLLVPLAWGAMAASALLFLASFVVDHALRHTLTFDPDAGCVFRRLTLRGRSLGVKPRLWLRSDEITELHLHRTRLLGYPSERLYLALRSGERVLLYRYEPFWDYFAAVTGPVLLSHALQRMAERIAAFADCPIRCIRGRKGPSAAQIQEAARQRALDACEPRLLPGDRDETHD